MRKIFVISVLLATSFCSLGAQETISLRVMTMNVKEGAKYASYASEPYAELIRQYSPDVVAFQEVHNRTLLNGVKDWLSEVAIQTGMMPYFCKSISYMGGDFGVGILSRYPFYKAEKIVSVMEGAREDRATGWIYIMLPSGAKVRVASTHLALESSQITIRNIADVNKNIFAEDTQTPTLLIGDFNATPDSDAITYARNKWQNIITDNIFTLPSDDPDTRLDYVMGYPKSWECTHYEVIARPDLSDHCFIVADVTITVE